jgi:maltooligosyltrehalose trehalohydrolase
MPGTFRHEMPFGAALQPDGRTRFRLWAPGQTEVTLRLLDRDRSQPMQRLEDGWFACETQAGAGDRYLYRLQDGMEVPDPASRGQLGDVHGPSRVIDPQAYSWEHVGWRGRPWHETVLYELHVGTFTPEGTYEAARDRLGHLRELGVTAVELMPLADCPGAHNWGYDGVLLYAPERSYGTPEDLKKLIDEAHRQGLMMFLDVVYNHFGPEGNYLPLYAPGFFTADIMTPWGPAIDYARRPVRDFAIHNALYWLEEYRFDGLRLDAVHAIRDRSEAHLLTELAREVRKRITDRHVHLVLENDANEAQRLRRDGDGRRLYDAQWNDDSHHVAHVIATGETDGYYAGYADRPVERLARALGSGFVYQGEPASFAKGAPRGEPSGDLPPTAFVTFLQNHDQIGNRAMGERLGMLARTGQALEALRTIYLLAPNVPMLFMGEEWGASTPFLYFCDFHGDLADAVREGRRNEFAAFAAFADPGARESIPDPNAVPTFEKSKLRWGEATTGPHGQALDRTRHLLALRQRWITPRLAGIDANCGKAGAQGTLLEAQWLLNDRARLELRANLGDREANDMSLPAGQLIAVTPDGSEDDFAAGRMPAWSAAWFLELPR